MAVPSSVPRSIAFQLVLLAVALLLLASACGGGGTEEYTLQDVDDASVVAMVAAYPASGTAPLTSNLDGSGSWALDGGQVTYSWDFDGDGVFDKLEGEALENHTWEEAGTYNVVLLVTDSSGSYEYDTVEVVVSPGSGNSGGTGGGENGEPVAQISVWPSTGEAPLEVTLDASGCWAQDGGALTFEYDYEGDGTYDLETSESSVTHMYSEGTYTPTVRVTDSGGLTATAGQQITVAEGSGGQSSADPVAQLSAWPSQGESPLEVTLDATGCWAQDGGALKYEYDYEGDGTFDLETSESSVTHTYTEGTFNPAVRVTDSDGRTATASQEIAISVGSGNGGEEEQGPIAVLISTPVSGAPPLTVTLNASSSVALGSAITSYDWDLDGDEAFEILDGGSQQSVTFTDEGLHFVYVRVNDADGLSGTGQAAILVSSYL